MKQLSRIIDSRDAIRTEYVRHENTMHMKRWRNRRACKVRSIIRGDCLHAALHAMEYLLAARNVFSVSDNVAVPHSFPLNESTIKRNRVEERNILRFLVTRAASSTLTISPHFRNLLPSHLRLFISNAAKNAANAAKNISRDHILSFAFHATFNDHLQRSPTNLKFDIFSAS